jgi:hypothetical protein
MSLARVCLLQCLAVLNMGLHLFPGSACFPHCPAACVVCTIAMVAATAGGEPPLLARAALQEVPA